jgi:hypothetical protein
MWFAARRQQDPPFRAAAALPQQLIEDASGSDVFRLRRDAVQAARVLLEVEPALAFTLPREGRAHGPTWPWLLATAAALVAGALLTFLLMRTVWAPSYQCHSYPSGTFTCAPAR